MTLEETCAYIDHGLSIVGRKERLFSDEAKMAIFKRTNGIARDVNTLCYQALLRAAVESKQIVDTQDLPTTIF
jgi:type II secretory pathway predicted ATPase ExeA